MTSINLQLHLVDVKMSVKAQPAALPLLMTSGTASTEGMKAWTKSPRQHEGHRMSHLPGDS